MAKNANNYGISPWKFKKGAIDDFILVTDSNRKNAIVSGRIYYFFIESMGHNYIFQGAGVIRPRLTKGWFFWPHMPWATVPKEIQNKTHWKVFYDTDEDYVKWKDDYDFLISKGINEKTLYICPKDPILIFYKE